MAESVLKLARLRAFIKAHGLEGVIFTSRAQVAWVTGGADHHLVSQSETGIGAVVVTARGAWVVASTIEIERLRTEEPFSGFTPVSFPWTGSLKGAIAELMGAKSAGFASDAPTLTGGKALPGDFAAECRASLTEHEVRRYKALGRDCSVALETVARQLNPGDSEFQAEADLARHLLARGIQPHVLLVAFDERLRAHRHPTPTAKRLARMGMLVVCGQRGGLIANLTRLIHFGALPADLAQRHEAVCRIEATLWDATVPGAAWGKVLKTGITQYEREGFAQEWSLHHQGGPTGYAGRDYLVVPTEKRLVQDGQAVAWNPSITGTKSEDTFIVQGTSRVVVTAASPSWPTLSVTGPSGRPLERPAILVR